MPRLTADQREEKGKMRGKKSEVGGGDLEGGRTEGAS